MVTEADLPTGKEVHNKIKAVKGATPKELELLREFIFAKTDVLIEMIDDYFDSDELVEDPEIVVDRLLKFHFINSGLLGLAVAIERHSKYVPYKELTEESRLPDTSSKKAKLTQADRENYARGEAADIEGLRSMLERYDKNLSERIQLQKGNRSKW